MLIDKKIFCARDMHTMKEGNRVLIWAFLGKKFSFVEGIIDACMHIAFFTSVRGFFHPCLVAICGEGSSSDATLLKPLTSSLEHLRFEPHSSLLEPASTRQDYALLFPSFKTPPTFSPDILF